MVQTSLSPKHRCFLVGLGHLPGSALAILFLCNLGEFWHHPFLFMRCTMPITMALGAGAPTQPHGNCGRSPMGFTAVPSWRRRPLPWTPNSILTTASWENRSGNNKNRLEFVQTPPATPLPAILKLLCKSGFIHTFRWAHYPCKHPQQELCKPSAALDLQISLGFLLAFPSSSGERKQHVLSVGMNTSCLASPEVDAELGEVTWGGEVLTAE